MESNMKQNANPCSVLRATALLAVSAVLCAANLAQGETTAQYVRDGLLACWDGVENAGYRQHAAETDEWIDTVGA